MKRTLIVLVMAAALAVPMSSSAGAAVHPAKAAHPTYALGRARACDAGYVKTTAKHKVEGHVVRYVACSWNPSKALSKLHLAGQFCSVKFVGVSTTAKNAATIKCERRGSRARWVQTKAAPVKVTATAPQLSYSASVDPSFTQGTDAPLDVFFSYSASADSDDAGIITNLQTTDELPDGVLDFFLDGALECSIDVGGATSGGACGVTLASTGVYTAVTEYVPNGITAVTDTEQVTVNPYTTTTAIDDSVVGSTLILASGTAGAGLPSVASGQIQFTVYDNGVAVETYTTTSDDPAACTLSEQTLGSQFIFDTTSPDYCTGANAGSVSVPLADEDGGLITFTATFVGSPGYSASTSSPSA